ncbi:MAG: site-2 protease family protein [Pirellulales bacterium]
MSFYGKLLAGIRPFSLPTHPVVRPMDPPADVVHPAQERGTDIVRAEIVRPARRRILVPSLLFVATCATTYVTGTRLSPSPWSGFQFSVPLMFLLTAHEMGHFLQTLRHRVPASLPFFLPVPFGPFGTMGAVIAMRPHIGDRRALFDIAITGPIAGLIPALIFSAVGLSMSKVSDVPPGALEKLGEPLIFKAMIHLIIGPFGQHQDVFLHPIAFAGWVGIFLTALNLIPIGQLDGGHILYTLLRKRAHSVATGLLYLAVAAVVISGNWGWTLMLILLLMMGPNHPPTANDDAELGSARIVLGWLALLFVIVGFTPTPFFVSG